MIKQETLSTSKLDRPPGFESLVVSAATTSAAEPETEWPDLTGSETSTSTVSKPMNFGYSVSVNNRPSNFDESAFPTLGSYSQPPNNPPVLN